MEQARRRNMLVNAIGLLLIISCGIPAGVKADVTVESGSANVNAGPGWSQNGRLHSQRGSGPTLTSINETGAGSLTRTP